MNELRTVSLRWNGGLAALIYLLESMIVQKYTYGRAAFCQWIIPGSTLGEYKGHIVIY